LFISALAVNKCVQGNASRTSDLPPMQRVLQTGAASNRLDRLLPLGPRAECGPALHLRKLLNLLKLFLCWRRGAHSIFKAWSPILTKVKVNCDVQTPSQQWWLFCSNL